MKLSVVIPCYRSSDSLPELMARLRLVLDGLSVNEVKLDSEVVLVVDGSPDDTADVARQLAAEDTRVRVIELMRNYGQHNALLAALNSVETDIVVTLDDDLQHRPEDIPQLIETLFKTEADVVYGISETEEHSISRSAASRMSKRIIRMAGAPKDAEITSFRAFTGALLPLFTEVKSPYVTIDVILSWGTVQFGTCVVEMHERTTGKSGYTFRGLVRYFITVLIGYSTVPLKLATWLGISSALFAAVFAVLTIVNYFTQGVVAEGFTTLAILVAFLGGIQLFSLGLIGEYIGRSYMKDIGKPPYLVRQ